MDMSNSDGKEAARYHDLDALRAVAMLLGIALHGALSFVPFPWMVQDSEQNSAFGSFFFLVHGFRMPVFFVMSGFFTAMLWRRRGLFSTLKQRFLRVFLPCMVGSSPSCRSITWRSSLPPCRETLPGPGLGSSPSRVAETCKALKRCWPRGPM